MKMKLLSVMLLACSALPAFAENTTYDCVVSYQVNGGDIIDMNDSVVLSVNEEKSFVLPTGESANLQITSSEFANGDEYYAFYFTVNDTIEGSAALAPLPEFIAIGTAPNAVDPTTWYAATCSRL